MQRILLDSEEKPLLFSWWGPQPREAAIAWAEARGWLLPEELLDIWTLRGGCDLFETETLLAPFGDSSKGDDIESIALHHASRGMPPAYMPFHVGMAFSVYIEGSRQYAVVNTETYEVCEQFESFGDWYSRYLRPLFAERYGLSAES
jgi:hypothetical protein